MSKFVRYLVASALFAVLAPHAGAATYVVPDDATLIGKAHLIVRGQVTSLAPVQEPSGGIVTEVTITLDRVLKGSDPGRTVVVRQPGGRLGDRMTVFPGIGAFAPGEDVLLMLDETPQGRRLTDFALGKFRVERAADGTEIFRRDGLREATLLAPVTSTEGSLKPGADVDRAAGPFERYIEDVVAGRPARADYAVTAAAAPLAVGEFNYLGTPPSRWIEFSTGGTITYKDAAAGDAGCPSGCHTEVANGVTGWNGAAGALITLAYGGTDGTVGNKCLDQLDNQIQFNDPCGEITNLSSCSGTLALGGFSGFSNGGGKTCADMGSVDMGRIDRAVLLINNGVGACLSSCNYRDMVTHEVGHTLGAGHSGISSALMAPTLVNGRCGALAADDIAFAQCSYAGTPAPCTAPTVASASAKMVSGLLRALVFGSGFRKGDRVEIDAGSGFVPAPKTVFKRRTKVVGKDVAAIWPVGTPVQVRVVTATGCESNSVSSIR